MPATISVLDGGGSSVTVNTLPALGQAVMASSLPVALASNQGTIGVTPAAGELHLGSVGGNSAIVGTSTTRPGDTTAYSIGDLIANSTTAGSVVPIPCAIGRVNDGTAVIRRIRLSSSQTGLAGTEIVRVHLFKNSPTTSVGDNAGTTAGCSANFNGVAAISLGSFDITLSTLFNDGAKGFTTADVVCTPSSGTQNIFALLEARTAIAGVASVVYTLALEVLQD